MTGSPRGSGRSDVARCWAGFASLGAGLVHFAVVREHLDYWVPAGVFFVVIGALQVGWALAALARDRVPVPRLVVAATLALLAFWAFTRTVGLPFGPDAGQAEAVGRADVLCMVLLLLLVGSVLAAVRFGKRSSGREPAPRTAAPRAALAGLAAGALVMSALTTPALAATEAGERARPHFHHSGGHGQ